eukprot:scaffold2045_cov203-Alexandrium_tamarense.AAC.6
MAIGCRKGNWSRDFHEHWAFFLFSFGESAQCYFLVANFQFQTLTSLISFVSKGALDDTFRHTT